MLASYKEIIDLKFFFRPAPCGVNIEGAAGQCITRRHAMKKILVENIQDGMVLAREVFGSTGSALLNKGTVLTVAMGRRLKNWGVGFVTVEGEEEHHEEKQVVEISSEKVHAELSEKFAGLLDDPIMSVIFNAVCMVKSRSGAR
jgi:DUF917 family protein